MSIVTRMRPALWLTATLLVSAISAAADPLDFKGKDYLAMNENYRTGLIHGLLASWVDLGSPERYKEFILSGYGCLERQRRTIPMMAIDFGRYIESHPDVQNKPVSVAFLAYFVDCPEK